MFASENFYKAFKSFALHYKAQIIKIILCVRKIMDV